MCAYNAEIFVKADFIYSIYVRPRVDALVEALRYKPEGRWFDPDGDTGIFHRHNPSGPTMTLGSTQLLTEMSTRNIFGG